MDDFLEFPFNYLVDLGLNHFVVEYRVHISQGNDKFLYYRGNVLDLFDLKLLVNSKVQLYNEENNELLDLKKSLLDILSGRINLICEIKKEI